MDYKVGDTGLIERTISESDIYTYAGITGDLSWLHLNSERAKSGRFGQRIVHGMYLLGLISATVGTQMPGPGTIYVSQDIKFYKPVFIGDTIQARTEILAIIPEAGRIHLKTTCTNQYGITVASGEAVVIPPTP